MEDDLNERRPQWKTTLMEEDLQLQMKRTSIEDDLSGRPSQWKTISMEGDIKEALQEADDINLPS